MDSAADSPDTQSSEEPGTELDRKPDRQTQLFIFSRTQTLDPKQCVFKATRRTWYKQLES